MPKKLKVKTLATYNGHSIKNNKAIDLNLRFTYDELPSYIQLIQFLNENTALKIKRGDQESQNLGTFMIKEIKIDNDGEGLIKFNSMTDYANVDEITTIVGYGIFKIQFEATAEDAGDEDAEQE